MMILGKEYKKFLFVHVPKTAGSSIFTFLYKNGLDHWDRTATRRHDSYKQLLKNNSIDEDVFSFAVVRNPYTRTYSCFKQYCKTNFSDISFIEYLTNTKNGEISAETPLLHLPQYKYVIDSSDNIAVTKLYKFENLKELEDDIMDTLTFDNVGEYDAESYYADYTEEAINIVQDLYDKDFEMFKYSKDFN
jgi:hypothetical protein